MNEKTRTELEAAAFRQLVEHLRERKDVQNIDLMNLAGFCRNCLSKWYRAAAESSPSAPMLLRDISCRIRAARRFLNYAADHYLHRIQPTWATGF